MTEIKYIFPKQLQSVAALAFMAVLIILLLILTVMVHMRNRKPKRTLHEKERQEFKNWTSTGHLKEQLSRKERITYHYDCYIRL